MFVCHVVGVYGIGGNTVTVGGAKNGMLRRQKEANVRGMRNL
jgi:hypothetical protein